MIVGLLLLILLMVTTLLVIDIIECTRSIKEMTMMNAHLSKLVHETKKVVLKHGK